MTIGLVALGAAAGAAITLVGHITIMLSVGLPRGRLAHALHLALDPGLLGLLLPRGALLGALVGPPVAWALLRRVPIGWAALGVSVGALIGGVGGDLLLSAAFRGGPAPIRFGWLWCAVGGVVLAALVLRRLFAPAAPAPPTAPAAVAANEELQLTEARPAPAVAMAPAARLRR
ncbi:hypothetical protein rosag_24410 [Roseisolibacter agri]|uniref:Uncharacterized protein n=1 Tax=Roseisolibacter agri TaxID=2014610 RepID=A0AA37QHL8_9BACT|nr:hypothetical protein rosag_24410 [Roseisolibacter agri]